MISKRLAVFLLFLTCASGFSQNFDARLFHTINKNHSPAGDRFWAFQSNSVKPLAIGLPLGFLATGIITKDQKARETGVLMAAAALLNFGVTYGMKHTFDRTRPYKALDNVHTVGSLERSPSFPSGHTSSSFTTATMMSLAYPKWYVIVPSYTWAVLAGYSRIKLGMHYPSDVLVGALVGAGSAILIYSLRKPILKFTSRAF